MKAIVCTLASGSRSLSYFFGLCVFVFAISTGWTTLEAQQIAQWALRNLGVTFLSLFGLLVFAGLFCWTRLLDCASDPNGRMIWVDSGLHAANGISTLALTYTLLGICLGIGTLSYQSLTPESVESVIRSLTGNFSMAFMTTVIGLPTSAMMRALISITATRLDASQKILTRN